jgi:hypothetical protein
MRINYKRVLVALIVLIFGLGIVFPAAIIVNEPSPHWNLASIGALIIIELAVVRLFFIATRKFFQPLAITFWIFVLFWLGLATFAQTLSNRFFWAGSYPDDVQAIGIGIVLLGIASYELGRSAFKHWGRAVNINATIPISRIVYAALIAFASVALAVYELGGFASVVTTRANITKQLVSSIDITKTEGLIFRILLQVPAYVALLFTWYFVVNRKKLIKTRKDYMIVIGILVALLGLNLIANFPVAIARYWLGTIALSLLFISLGKKGKSAIILILIWIVAILIVFPATFNFRYTTDLSSILNTVQVANPVEHLYFGDYDAYQQLLNVVIYVRSNGLVYGRNILGALLFWVPRSLWLDKPLGTGSDVTTALGYPFTNVSSPLWAEGYYAFGAVGVILLLFLYGYFSELIDISYQRNYSPSNLLYFVAPYWMAYQIFFLRGDLLNALAYSVPVLGLMWLYSRKHTRLRFLIRN